MNDLDKAGTLRARAHQGLKAAPVGRGRKVAIAIGISLSMAMPLDAQASNQAIRYVKDLADYQLTEVQESCHNEIVYRESRFKHNAVNGSHYGYYQMRNTLLKDAPYDVQFYYYWKYVAHRYGLDLANEDVPNYCAALHHLKRKGWQ